MEGIKINKLEIENVKRIKAVKITPSEKGLTIIGGKNAQGKTSVLDAIAWALGGDSYRPSKATREGSAVPPNLKVTMSNGLVVERKGKNSSLKVTDPTGQKAGQQLLNTFVEGLALDLPKFMEASNKEKAQTLLRIIGVGDQLAELEHQEKELYSERGYIGRTADQKKKFAEEQPYYPDAPQELVSPSELIRQQQDILARNGENQKKRERAAEIQAKRDRLVEEINRINTELEKTRAQLMETQDELEIAKKSAENLQDESTAELEESIANIEETNRKVRANMDKDKAEEDARHYSRQYDELTKKIEDVRSKKAALLDGAKLPLPGLSIEDRELTYQGQKWDNMSGSERLKVATAIIRQLKPECGFVLIDKLEQMDLETLNEFGAWLESEGLQAIATRVSTGDECSVIIEDGYAVASEEPEQKETKKWEAGKF